jgi:Protein of unknown function (DUF742).
MNDGWNEWGPRVPDPRMIGLRRATPARPAQELFPISPRQQHGDILSDPPEQDHRAGHHPGPTERRPGHPIGHPTEHSLEARLERPVEHGFGHALGHGFGHGFGHGTPAGPAPGHVAHPSGHHGGPPAPPAGGGAHVPLPAPVADRRVRRAGDHPGRRTPDHHVRWGDGARYGHERPVRLGGAAPPADGLMDGPTMKVSTSGEIVRPFIMTAGRTRPLDERLRIETLLSATPAALNAPLAFEHAHIVELCREPLSVGEIAAGLRLPVGIARLLIADLVAEHYLVIHAQIVPGVRPPRELLERIRAGVRAL